MVTQYVLVLFTVKFQIFHITLWLANILFKPSYVFHTCPAVSQERKSDKQHVLSKVHRLYWANRGCFHSDRSHTYSTVHLIVATVRDLAYCLLKTNL